jgi:HK97 family phage prohead protease
MFSASMRDAAVERARVFSGTDRGASSRPKDRRAAPSATDPAGARLAAHVPVQVRAMAEVGGKLSFEGCASVYSRGYTMADSFGEYVEIVDPGAGAASLARENLDVPLVLQHDSLRRIASTVNGSLALSETAEGLMVSATLNPADADVAYIRTKIEDGLIHEMSFRFTITKSTWSPDYTQLNINSYDIHRGDVAIVGYGANPFTSGGIKRELPVLRKGASAARLAALGL